MLPKVRTFDTIQDIRNFRPERVRAFYLAAGGCMVIAVSGEFGDDLKRFVYFRVENGRILERECVNAVDGPLDQLAAQLNSLKIDLLIAGKLCREVEVGLFEAGINLISGINGESDRILNDYLNGNLQF
jgi:predicted Fe-Mo cluster-binding NifX family protein